MAPEPVPRSPESVPKCAERAPRSRRNRCPGGSGTSARVRAEYAASRSARCVALRRRAGTARCTRDGRRYGPGPATRMFSHAHGAPGIQADRRDGHHGRNQPPGGPVSYRRSGSVSDGRHMPLSRISYHLGRSYVKCRAQRVPFGDSFRVRLRRTLCHVVLVGLAGPRPGPQNRSRGFTRSGDNANTRHSVGNPRSTRRGEPTKWAR